IVNVFLSLQLSSGNPIYDKYYRQVDPTGSGRVAAADAALFLKRSALADLVLGKIWDLADSERKGALNKQQFFIALRLVACAQNGLEVALKSLHVAVPPPKFHDTSSPLLAGGGVAVDIPWVVKPEEKMKFDSIFESLGPVGGILTGDKVKPVLLNSKLPVDILVLSLNKTDGDMDGLVSGPEVRDIFLKTGLPSATLARIWELCDIGDIGKLTREQFALALHLINQRLTKGLEPPQSLSPEMIPPSDRQNIKQNNVANLAADFSAIKELDSLSNEIVELQREKITVEEEIKEKEEAIRQRSNEVQDLQDEVARESEVLQRLQAQRQKVQEALEELDQQKGSLEEQLTHIRQQTNQETNLISSLQSEHEEQEQKICQFEEELVQAREELLALQEESMRLQEKVQAAQEQLTPLQESVRDSFTQVAQVGFCESLDLLSPQKIGPVFYFSLSLLFLKPLHLSALSGSAETERLDGIFFNFIDDPFKDDPFGKADVAGPFGEDPFKGSDPFAADSFFQASSAPFASGNLFSASADPFSTTTASNDPFAPGGTTVNASSDPDPFAAVFGNESFGGGFVLFTSCQYPTEEDMIEWAKRESEREEKERLARLTQQEQEDLELAIALSKSELS
uniref:Epidermal growth factor receptor pathway substrate 15 n=1 Tax=Sander lucioperca TaxID=283035 RepID=A0A8C9YHD0_SANLU